MKVIMQVNTNWQGKRLRVGDDETVSDDVARRWVSKRIAAPAESVVIDEDIVEDLDPIKDQAGTEEDKDVKNPEPDQGQSKEEVKPVELIDMTVAQLKELATEKGIVLKADMKKADIVIAITEALEMQVD